MTVSCAHGGAALGSATFGPKAYESIARQAGFTSFEQVGGNGKCAWWHPTLHPASIDPLMTAPMCPSMTPKTAMPLYIPGHAFRYRDASRGGCSCAGLCATVACTTDTLPLTLHTRTHARTHAHTAVNYFYKMSASAARL